MSAFQAILQSFRDAAQTEREKGNYFEELVKAYLINEPSYKDLFNGQVYLWEEWRKHWIQQGNNDPGVDAGIDLVAIEDIAENPRIFAIQAKFYAEDARLRKGDGIDSFLSAMGKAPFTNGMLFLTTSQASSHVIEVMQGRDKPVNVVVLSDLENSQIDWAQFQSKQKVALKEKKTLRPHQQNALNAVKTGLSEADRGKLIMACGTGKTFTSLKIAEDIAGPGKRILFLVPSLALLSQTLTEWTQESVTPMHSFAVCSDSDVGKKRQKGDDSIQIYSHELRYPATTNPASLAKAVAIRHDNEHMSVIYATYHSIDVISQAQQNHGLEAFDLIICDEAHRTTGFTFEGDDESHFVKVHDNDYLKAHKRIYMTATPRIFGEAARATAERDNVALYDMDDETQYGKQLHALSFSEAVKRGLLVDYKVIVLTVEESHISRRIQNLLKDDDNQLRIDDAAKIVGCWKALSKQGLSQNLADDEHPMKRAVAFCQVIEERKGARTPKVASKNIAAMFQAVVEAYQESAETDEEVSARLYCEAEHVDGSMNASEKDQRLKWLKADTPEETCRILSNVRCLSEGVDVPALDAVLFLTPRNSQVDVVQSVGRVMRNAPGKKRGYIVLPVVIPAGTEPHEALNDNKTYKVVWQVLQALRSHDDRFDAMVNKLDLIGSDTTKMEVVAVTDKIQRKTRQLSDKKKSLQKARKGMSIGVQQERPIPEQAEIEFEIGEIERAIYAKLVQKVGNRHHWEDWANDIAKIANTHIDRIKGILENPANTREIGKFQAFAKELRDDLNDSITDDGIVEMLAQHLVTKPVFDALFDKYSFAKHNPMSLAMQQLLDTLQEHRLDKEAQTLEAFYESVKLRAEGIDSAEGKQRIVVELYDKFFRNAFPKMTKRLGIVYTPVEVVDFIIHSVQHILKTEFGESLGSKNVHIIDPFTGTGTFITRLMQSGLISKEQLKHKYQHEIHANEIVLLAYYIAAINIEATYHDIVAGEYLPFEGICLTDTFQMYESEDLVSKLLADNSDRRKRQKDLDIRVIVGNPPYSSSQKDAADNNENVVYPLLDERIANTYIKKSARSDGKSKAYDSYIRAIRWASDRIGQSGVIGFVTNAGYVDANTADGLRKSLQEEFSSVYVFHLRGNQRTQGELSRKEGGKIFRSGSRAPIAISILVKNPHASEHGQIHFHDIGDYLSREEKLVKISQFKNVSGIDSISGWTHINPDRHGDWVSQRDNSFDQHILIGSKKDISDLYLFKTYSMGIKTNRDDWVFSSSQSKLVLRTKEMISFYNAEVAHFKTNKEKSKSERDIVSNDKTKIKWTSDLLNSLSRGRTYCFVPEDIVPSLRRPYFKQYLYRNKAFNWTHHLMQSLFPTPEIENRCIYITGTGVAKEFSVIVSDTLPDFQLLANGQAFPLFTFEKLKSNRSVSGEPSDLFDDNNRVISNGFERSDGITNGGLAYFQKTYPGESISKEDIFYYTYGVLHSPDYRQRFADNLSKELPRIPRVSAAADFWAFCKAGRNLAALHLNYETVEPYPATIETKTKALTDADYRVTKMKYGKQGKERDLTTLHYNEKITVTGIPLETYEYVVNGKPALDWVVERQCVKTDKASGIVNDANDWAIETMNNPKYPLELVLRVITVSLETMKIVRSLPKLDI
jgi:predicted helicase